MTKKHNFSVLTILDIEDWILDTVQYCEKVRDLDFISILDTIFSRLVKTPFPSTEEPGCGNVFQVGHCHRLQSPLGFSVKMEYVHALLEGFLGFQ